ncbi:hypothetical protein BCR42DRAFT_97415 [Absidia repens]|uniref:Rad51-like C-terminal domain-containing protein n=1 Tax=Absidia repens TaxID=90262 RepID=A0A1X2I929_9FUNG|nr:hypothetical protein BCR42DRAFT_97415 [Absidia repens]
MPPKRAASVTPNEDQVVNDQNNPDSDDEVCDQTFYTEVEELQSQGITMVDINKLKGAGICTISGVQMATKRSLLKVKGLSEAKVDKVKDAAAKLQVCGFLTGVEVSQKREHVMKISTGSHQLDTLLGGGIQTMSITEGKLTCEESNNIELEIGLAITSFYYRYSIWRISHWKNSAGSYFMRPGATSYSQRRC